MHMHTMWKGSISFGLVHIPIKLYAATESKNVSLRQLHNECHTPIKYDKKCPTCDQAVSSEDIVKGYEYEKGKFVLINDDEIEGLGQETSRTIEIIDFIQLKEIDPIYFEKSYYIGPNENGEKAYTLLKTAMEDTEKVGIAKIVLRNKEHLAAIRVYDNALVMETIHFPDEIRNVKHIPGLQEDVELKEKELKMAKQLVEQLTTEFEPEKYKDDYREAFMELIQSKVTGEGKDIKVAKEVPQTDITHLMDALQASINQTKSKPKAKPKTTKKKTAKKATS